LRIVATRDGAIVSSPKGCFSLVGRSGSYFISDILPALYGARQGGGSLPKWVTAVGDQLEQAGIVQRTVPPRIDARIGDHRALFAVAPQTPLTIRVSDRLAGLGFTPAGPIANSTFVILDLSGLRVEDALQLTREVHRSECRVISIWRRGSETLYGPLVEPRRTACWNCCRQRFFDSLSGEQEAIEDDAMIAKVIADNAVLAVRYPNVAGYGCVLVDDGRVSSLHSVVPMPWCEVCGLVTPRELRLTPLTHSLHVPEQLRGLADARGGIVRRVLLYEGDGTEAPSVPFCCTAVIAPYWDGTGSHFGCHGEGKGATRAEAVLSAIGEGIERYAASLWDPRALIYSPFSEMEGQAFDPRWLVLYGDAQYAHPDFPFAPFAPQQPIYWTKGCWLDTGEAVQVPALATYLNFPAQACEQFGQTTSNGLAAGATFEDAALRALYELIERDAFMLFWLARRPAMRIAGDGCDELTARALRDVERLGARTELYLIDVGTQHPTIVCLGLGDGRSWPAVTIGLGTHANVDIALRRAVFEHGHYGSYIRRLMREGRHHKVRRSEDVLNGLDHALYYVHPEHVAALDSFRGAREAPASLAQLRTTYHQDATLSTCVSRLSEVGIRTAAVDMTTPDIALAPVRVVRAFGIYLQPIHFGAANGRLKNPRLERLLSDDAETMPHPIA
jgi:ribosomal protein S12 methylthiotransferase accessory factor